LERGGEEERGRGREMERCEIRDGELWSFIRLNLIFDYD
jgi:hypothetical protein